MSVLKDLKLFTTQAHPCSYLEGEQAKTLFIDPEFSVNPHMHTRLTELGFRRSGEHIYRPHCDSCNSCVACRVPVAAFSPNRRFRRILKRNRDVEVTLVENINTEEYFALYACYINTRHQNGDMYPATKEQFNSFLAKACQSTLYYRISDSEHRLLGVIVSDQLDNALSAVYTFFDPSQAHRSLGNFAILWQIEQARHLNLDYLYLGYWIRDCNKMNYKSQFRPIEMLINNRWLLLK